MRTTTDFIETQDQLRLHTVRWEPDGATTRGIILHVHGLGEYAERYKEVARCFTDAGLAFCSFDLRGHGHSQGKIGHFPDINILLDDVARFQAAMRPHVQNVPSFIYGHSLGGNIALNYLLRRQPALQGAIISSPWLHLTKPPPPFLLDLLQNLGKYSPSFALANGLDPNHMSRDPEEVKKFTSDPLIHNRISVSTLLSAIDAGKWATDHASDLSIPTYLFHGAADAITNPKVTQVFAEQLQGEHVFKLWEGGYHELHNDLDRDAVISSMVDWTLAQIIDP